jgi:hypothetical protein
MNGCTRRNVVRFQGLVIGKLLPRVNQLDLIDLDSFFFLQGLLYGKNLIFRFKIESLLAACQRFDKDLKRSGDKKV